jgi:acetyl esterase/lipase
VTVAARRELRDIPYASESDNQRLDLYLPNGVAPESGNPLVVAIHGGAFRWGDRTRELDALDALIEAGFAVASVGYRLSGEAIFPAAVDDVREAVRFLRQESARLEVDPLRFAAWGRSAGGYLAAMLGVLPDRATGFDTHSAISESARVQAVVDWYGPSDFMAMDAQFRSAPPSDGSEVQWHDDADSPESRFLGGALEQMAPLAQLASVIAQVRDSDSSTPFFVAAGDQDPLVPHQQSVALADALGSTGHPVVFTLIEGVGHASPRFEAELTAPAIEWLRSVLG